MRRRKSARAAGQKAIENQHNKGRLTARERISLLVDPGTFFEIGAFAAYEECMKSGVGHLRQE